MIRYAEPGDEYPDGVEAVPGGALTVLVLEPAGQGIGGLAAFGPADGEPRLDVGELSALSLLPDGWASGDGGRLLDAAVEELRWAGFSEAVTWVLEGDAQVRRFYEQAAWEADGGEKASIEKGLVLRRARYRRPIPSSPMALRFDKADPGDIDGLLKLSDDLARWMVGRGIDQWQPGDLPAGRVRHFIVDGETTVLRHLDDIVGAVAITWEDPFAWDDGVGAAGYVHQLMLDRAFEGRGLGRRLLQRAERRILEGGHQRARLDCVTTNAALRRYYERAGYRHVGETDYGGRADLKPSALYEKRLTSPAAATA